MNRRGPAVVVGLTPRRVWIIERRRVAGRPPRWWCGGASFTSRPENAVRFASREQAERAIEQNRALDGRCVYAVETEAQR